MINLITPLLIITCLLSFQAHASLIYTNDNRAIIETIPGECLQWDGSFCVQFSPTSTVTHSPSTDFSDFNLMLSRSTNIAAGQVSSLNTSSMNASIYAQDNSFDPGNISNGNFATTFSTTFTVDSMTVFDFAGSIYTSDSSQPAVDVSVLLTENGVELYSFDSSILGTATTFDIDTFYEYWSFDFSGNLFTDRTYQLTALIEPNNGLSNYENMTFNLGISQIPVPPAIWLFASGLSLLGLRMKSRKSNCNKR